MTRDTMFARITRFAAVAALVILPGGPARPTAVRAQVLAPAPANPPETPPPSGAEPGQGQGQGQGQRVADLTIRYRFIERYSANEDPEHPEAVVQSRVAIRETIKIEADNPKGAPDRNQVIAQIIYAERPAQVGKDGLVSATVRRYDAFRLTPDPVAKPSEPRPLEGLLVWYQLQSNDSPLVLSLSPNRRMREFEYSTVSRQVFLPALSTALPSLPSRIGDRWRIPRLATYALLGERTQTSDVLTGTFEDLRTEPNGPNLVAVITVTGQVILPSGPTAYNARIEFTFPPPTSGENRVAVDARGAISELRSAQVTTARLPGDNDRLRQTRTRELILARQRDGTASLQIPDPQPAPTAENSWITFVDPRKRFTFQHPQTFQPDPSTGAESVALLRMRPGGPDVIGIQVQPKTGDPEKDRQNLDPESHRKRLVESWRQERLDVLMGKAEWLPEADWKPAGMKVFRIEAALRSAPGRGANLDRRVHYDYYLILTGRPESLVVTASTVQDPPIEFRKEAEDVIKTFRFGPPAADR